jgi:hypothetical protein
MFEHELRDREIRCQAVLDRHRLIIAGHARTVVVNEDGCHADRELSMLPNLPGQNTRL